MRQKRRPRLSQNIVAYTIEIILFLQIASLQCSRLQRGEEEKLVQIGSFNVGMRTAWNWIVLQLGVDDVESLLEREGEEKSDAEKEAAMRLGFKIVKLRKPCA